MARTSGWAVSSDLPESARFPKWFIGSGRIGRSFVYETGGYLWQSPVSYFAARGTWGLSPGFNPAPRAARPIEAPCLNCHTSGARLVAGTENRYENPPFTANGVTCERCHGDGARHALSGLAREVLNPAKLAGAARDSVCEQCHLTGAAKVTRPGAAVYQPGDLLSASVAVFIWNGAPAARAATDHAEQLARSKCRQNSHLWCGSCHSVHGAAVDQRATCLSCHATKPCTANVAARQARQDDCAACHMPKAGSREGKHVVYTDHTIARRVPARASALQAYWPRVATERDWALALAALDPAKAAPRLEALRFSRDAAVLVQLAQMADRRRDGARAVTLYEEALALEPSHPAAANLAIYRMQQGRTAEAIALWQRVFERYPSMHAAGLNLLRAQELAGDEAGAAATRSRIRRFHPELR